MKKTVELIQEWEWVCDECGRNNYASSMKAELSEEDADKAREEFGYDGEWVTKPDSVKCSHCGAEFDVEDDE